VQSPFRSEAAAFRFTMLTLAAFAAIVVAKVVAGSLAALVVFLLVLVAVFVAYVRARAERRPPQSLPRQGAEDERRILVVANETVGGETLRRCIREKSEGYREHVLVVAPALNSRLRQWTSDEDGARAAAQERLEHSLARLREAGVEARGEVGDQNPVQAIEDALRTFGADEVVISTHPPGRSNWLERGVVQQARDSFNVPITHVVVDLEAEREDIAAERGEPA
jgi:hypothetical protein